MVCSVGAYVAPLPTSVQHIDLAGSSRAPGKVSAWSGDPIEEQLVPAGVDPAGFAHFAPP